MSIATLERSIWKELKKVTGNNKIRLKDIMEWSTGEVYPQGEEKLVNLPELKINVTYLLNKKSQPKEIA